MILEPFHGDYEWWDSTYDNFCQITEIIGFDVSPRDIQFTGFWSQGDGASFTGSYRYAKQSAKRIREYAPLDAELHAIADMLTEMQRRNFYQVTGSIVRIGHHYVHENTIAADIERDSENYQDATDDAETIVTDAARRLSQWLYSTLESEWEYLETDDAGRQCGETMVQACEAGREYVTARRDICAAFKMRRAPLPHGAVRAFIRQRISDAREAFETWQDARNDVIAMIDESKPSARGWNAKNRDAWFQGYEYGRGLSI